MSEGEETGIKPYCTIAADKFANICEETVPSYLDGLESDDPEEIKNLTSTITKDLRDKLIEDDMKDYKMLLHTIILRKGDSSLYEDWELYWEKLNDGLAVWKRDTDKYYVLIYGAFIPLKVPADYYKSE